MEIFMGIIKSNRLFVFLFIVFLTVSCGSQYQIKAGLLTYSVQTDIYGFGLIKDVAELNALSAYQAVVAGVSYKIVDGELELEVNPYSGTLITPDIRKQMTNGVIGDGIDYVRYPIDRSLSFDVANYTDYRYKWQENPKNSDLFWLLLGDFFSETGYDRFRSGNIYIVDIDYKIVSDDQVKVTMEFIISEDTIE